MRFIKGLIILLLGAALVAFAASNRQQISVYFFLSDSIIEMPLFLFFFITLLAGIIICWLTNLIYRTKIKYSLREKDSQIKAMENELNSIKTEEKIKENLPV